MNLGSLVLWILLYIFKLAITFFVLFPVKKCFPKLKELYQQFVSQLFFDDLLSILFEAYLELLLMIMLYQDVIYQNPDRNSMNTIICNLTLIFSLIILPLSIVFVLMQPKQKLLNPDFQQRWGKLLENLKLDSKMYLTYRIWFVLRRIIFIGTVFLCKDNFTLQYLGLAEFNLFMIVYQGSFTPFKSKNLNFVEIFNESMMLLSSNQVIFFTDFVETLEERYLNGWVLIFLISINLFVNMSIVLKTMFKQFQLIIIKYYRIFENKYYK